MRLLFPTLAGPLMVVLALAGVTGCAKTTYRGAEPSARTFHEDPNPGDYYVGMDLHFAVEPDAPHLPAAHLFEADVR